MIPEPVSAILLAVPLAAMPGPSMRYWLEFKRERARRRPVRKAVYPRCSLGMLALGFLSLWTAWIGGVILLALNRLHDLPDGWTYRPAWPAVCQAAGFLCFYAGAVMYNLNLRTAGKYLRPAPAGITEDHVLIQTGPFAVIRHPLYVSYVLILIGLSFVLRSHWLLIPAALTLAGMVPAARAEEAVLLERFGAEYVRYRQRTGMFFPECRRKDRGIP